MDTQSCAECREAVARERQKLVRAALKKLPNMIGKRVRAIRPDQNAPDEGVCISIHPNHPGCCLVRFDGDDFETAVFPEWLEVINL